MLRSSWNMILCDGEMIQTMSLSPLKTIAVVLSKDNQELPGSTIFWSQKDCFIWYSEWIQKMKCSQFFVNSLNPNIRLIFSWAQLLKAWLALTSVWYLDNILVSILLNQWLKLTMLLSNSALSVFFTFPLVLVSYYNIVG